ncbi:MAG: hypothetical protein ACR2LC_12465 [Pyrinomonadaceae bacterium]
MNRVIKRLLGSLILAIAAFLFIVFTASINAAQSMGGPMNMSPSPEEWFYIVLVLDALFLLIAFGGIKLLGLGNRTIGVLSILIGIIILVIGAKNHVNAPLLDGINDTNKMPVPPFLHYVVYSFVGACLMIGSWLIAKDFVRKSVK